jgi:hypothetical protein
LPIKPGTLKYTKTARNNKNPRVTIKSVFPKEKNGPDAAAAGLARARVKIGAM